MPSRIDGIAGSYGSSVFRFPCTFSDHNAMRLEINYKEKNSKKKNKLLEAKQYATEKWINHWRNQRGNQKIFRDKWQ